MAPKNPRTHRPGRSFAHVGLLAAMALAASVIALAAWALSAT